VARAARLGPRLALALLVALAIVTFYFRQWWSRALPLPSGYDGFLEPAVPQSEHCDERFTPRYLDDFRSHAIQYCAKGSPASLHCFQGHSRGHDLKDVDALCIGRGAMVDVASQRFALDCELRAPSAKERGRGLKPFDRIRGEWANTGPHWIFNDFVKVERDSSGIAATQSAAAAHARNPRFALLIKREGDGNIFHCLMEIWSMMMTFDLLRTSPDPSRRGAPFFADSTDLPNTQAIVLDDHPDGKFLELWAIFTRRPPLRRKDFLNNPEQAATPRNIIIPLAGAANPVWQSDWAAHDCGHAPMLKAFVRRVLRFYGLADSTPDRSQTTTIAATAQDPNPNPNPNPNPPTQAPPPPQPPPPTINLTFINRTGKRQLLNQTTLLAAVEAKHPHVRIQAVDFEPLTFPEQLRLVRATDILVGVHGAGLTHTMFMRDGPASAVVEIRPRECDYRGFRNLAFMKGVGYFTAFGEQVKPVREGYKPRVGTGEDGRGLELELDLELGEGGNGTGKVLAKRGRWQWDHVRMEVEEFVELVDAAIAAVSNPRAVI
jgi:protein O-GlcNAc transferase